MTKFLEADTAKSPQQLLEEVRDAALTQSHNAPNLVFVPFATLLVRLSQEASATVDKILLHD